MANLELKFDRITYREGQRLSAGDLSDDHAREVRLGRLHTRYLHETWGIATGFDVQAAGPSAVAVGPGYALDDLARELVLAVSLAIPVPAVTGPDIFALVATFLGDRALVPRESSGAVCLDAPLRPGRERPAFAWVTASELEPGPMVPLCHVVVQNKQIQGGVQTRVRRYAQRLARPRFATGVTETGRGQWTTWFQSGNGQLHGLKQQISTLEAGFTSGPLYFAELLIVKPSVLQQTPAQMAQAMSQAHGHIALTATDSFEYRLVVKGDPSDALETYAVSWVGVEPLAGCPPAIDVTRLWTLGGSFFDFLETT